MKEKPLHFRKIELWLVSITFFLIILSNILGGKIGISNLGHNNDQMARYFAYIFMPSFMFVAFYLMHMKIIPLFQKEKKVWKLIVFGLVSFFVTWFLVGIFYVGSDLGNSPFVPFYFSGVALYAGYFIIASFLKNLILNRKEPSYLTYNILRLATAYTFLVIFLFKFHHYFHFLISIIYLFIIPALIFIFLYNYFLVYRNREIGKKKLSLFYFWLLPILMLITFVIIAGISDAEEVIVVGLVSVAALMLIVNPASNAIFKKYQEHIETLDTLNVQLEEKTTDLKQLRNQINPHFLFNALNTIYGISLQENAEKTSESVQKLGDMMRFMLHENTQEAIPLNREIDYLINYVDLQTLRIQEQENIDILFSRKEEHCKGNIAPMLLIPFIENAFKHGISLQKKSWVKINLRCLEGSLHLDINNSIHRKSGEDPENVPSGIGLNNVRQRLNLLYPNCHELVIRENDLEYFVHLSIQLNKS
ncbi:histidine kinase [Echinicola sp. CAU 1574]|uniref:Histidine kinase n=1 Tax=Echinicola arenosa TaxID=2774144 RepID=A0ABR9ASF2_9BACT|nr:histidine kinase [Echinicola arenosa]MBD8490549.1 histidine kinase [Echinicola arenosa]